jgi:hypothetical protein
MNTRTYTTPITIFEGLNRLNLEIYKVGHQERLAVDGDVASN